jgi:hypothetical protein
VTSNLVSDDTLRAWLNGAEENIESGVATDMVAVCPLALRRACRELIERRSRVETTTEPEDDPANAEVIARLKQAFGGDPDARVLGPAMCKIADGAMGPAHGCAILTHRECDAIGKEIRRLNRAARGESSEKTSVPPEDPHDSLIVELNP